MFSVQAAPALRARFREREETVKADVFSTFTVLLQQVRRHAAPSRPAAFRARQQHVWRTPHCFFAILNYTMAHCQLPVLIDTL